MRLINNMVNTVIIDLDTGTVVGPNIVAININGVHDDTLEEIYSSFSDAKAFVRDNPSRVRPLIALKG